MSKQTLLERVKDKVSKIVGEQNTTVLYVAKTPFNPILTIFAGNEQSIVDMTTMSARNIHVIEILPQRTALTQRYVYIDVGLFQAVRFDAIALIDDVSEETLKIIDKAMSPEEFQEVAHKDEQIAQTMVQSMLLQGNLDKNSGGFGSGGNISFPT